MRLIRIGKFSELNLAENQHGLVIEARDDEAREIAGKLYDNFGIISKSFSEEQAFNEIKNVLYSHKISLEISTKVANELIRKLGFMDRKE